MRSNIPVLFILAALLPLRAHGSWFVTGDADVRCTRVQGQETAELYLVSFSARKVISDGGGDRLILFLLGEGMHDFNNSMIGQAYAQYKGPLGKWNLLAGRFRLPFGLLQNYSTERLLVTTPEFETLGIAADDGVQLSGTLESLEYAVSASGGRNSKGILSFRAGYRGVDFEDMRFGVSGFAGRVLSGGTLHDRRIMSADLIKYRGLLVARAEAYLGTEDGNNLAGIFAGADYALLPRTDITLSYTAVDAAGTSRLNHLHIGLSYNPAAGFNIRAAKKIPAAQGGSNDEFTLQVYYAVSRSM